MECYRRALLAEQTSVNRREYLNYNPMQPLDIFALQDEITLCVVGAIEPSLRKAEIERVKRKWPESLDAYDLVLRAMPFVHSHIAEDAPTAIPLLEKAQVLSHNTTNRRPPIWPAG